jgi:putative membrane protein
MIKTIILQTIAGIAGIWLANEFVNNVEFIGSIKTLILCGFVLGLINSFIKPIVNIISLPLRILTFGLFSLVINMGLVWLLDVIFPELIIVGIMPLFYATLIVWTLSLIFSSFGKKSFRKKLEE